MKVKVKVLMNREAISEARQSDQKAEVEHFQKLERQEVVGQYVSTIEIPEPDIQEKTLFIDATKIELAQENELDMISLLYCGRDFMVVKTPELMSALEERFK